jgi:hypothetical protein
MKYFALIILALLSFRAVGSDFTDAAVINNMGLASGWTGSVFTYNNDIWIRSYKDGMGMYDYRVGAGGVISEMRDVQSGFEKLLAAPARSERTDRVIQEVWWGLNLNNTNGGSPDGRFNVNQAGTFEDGNSPRPPHTLTPTISVDVDANPGAPEVDVYSVPQDQWFAENQPPFTGKFSMLTRYKLIGNGWLMVRRVTLIGQIMTNNSPTNIRDLYIDAWTPFNKQVFDGMALDMDTLGNPTWWYQADRDMPVHTAFSAPATHGYAVAFSTSDHASKTAVGLVFGASQPQWYENQIGKSIGRHDFRCQEWSDHEGGGLCFKPNLRFKFPIPAGMVIDDYFVIVPSPQMDSQFAADVTSAESLIPAPRLFWPKTVLDGELADIVNQLNANKIVNGVRTDQLVPLINSEE